jgi:hypothetical protein
MQLALSRRIAAGAHIFTVGAFRFALTPQPCRWDHLATFGVKVKNGVELEFTEETLGEMIANWRARGDLLAMCQDHLSAYVEQTGRPAPAMAFYNALALVHNAQLVRFEALDEAVPPPDAATLPDGLHGYRSQHTPLGEDPREGLANYRYLSPMFTDNGLDEAGNPIGYALYDVAATNTPFQAGCAIQFHRRPGDAAARPTRTDPMKIKLSNDLYKKLGVGDDASDDDKRAAMRRFADEIKAKMADADNAQLARFADELEEMAKYTSEADGGQMSKLAAKMRKLAKLDDKSDDEAAEGEAKDKEKQEMAALCRELGLQENASASAIRAALGAKTVPMSEHAKVMGRVEKLEQERAAEVAADKETAVQRFVADAIATGEYDKGRKDKLVELARKVGVEDAKTALSPRGTWTLGKRYTAMGNPVNKPATPPEDMSGEPEAIGGFPVIGTAELSREAEKVAKERKIDFASALVEVTRDKPHLFRRQ